MPICAALSVCFSHIWKAVKAGCNAIGRCVSCICKAIYQCMAAICNAVGRCLTVVFTAVSDCCGWFWGGVSRCMGVICTALGECCSWFWRGVGQCLSAVGKCINTVIIQPIVWLCKKIYACVKVCFEYIVIKPIKGQTQQRATKSSAHTHSHACLGQGMCSFLILL